MKYVIALLGLSLLAACSTNPSKAILGTWETNVAGFPMQVTYTTETVRVDGHEEVSYQLVESTLTLASEGSQPRNVEFISRNEMVQIDPVAGTRQTFTRKTD